MSAIPHAPHRRLRRRKHCTAPPYRSFDHWHDWFVLKRLDELCDLREEVRQLTDIVAFLRH